MPYKPATVDQIREAIKLARDGRTLADLRSLMPDVTPGVLSEVWEAAQELRSARAELEKAALASAAGPPAGAPAMMGPGGNGLGMTAGPAPSWGFNPPGGFAPPWGFPPPPAMNPADVLKPAVDMMAAVMSSLVTVLTAERSRSPLAELPQLVSAMQSLVAKPETMPVADLVQAFKDGISTGAKASREAQPNGTLETVREIAAALSAIIASRQPAPMLRAPMPAGQTPAAVQPPAPAALVAAPGPAWDQDRGVTAVVDYGLRTNDDPRSVARVVKAKLPQDILLTLQHATHAQAVEWIMAQRGHIPALGSESIPNRRQWVADFVSALQGTLPPGEPGEDEDGDEELEDGEDEDGEPDELEDPAELLRDHPPKAMEGRSR